MLRAEPSALYARAGLARFVCEQGYRPTYDTLTTAGLAVAPETGGEAAAAIVFAGRDRAEALGLVALALERIPSGAPLIVTGAKADGIDGLVRVLGDCLPLADSHAKNHGKTAWLARPGTLPQPVTAWREAYALAPNADGFLAGPGMFSHARVDPGSRRLAAFFDARLAGRVADLGAGWGWLAARALAGAPAIAALDLVEAEARALRAARANVTDARAGFLWADVTRLARPTEPYDWVVTNPPFHRGRAAEPALGIAFVRAAARILRREGRLLMVANRQLPYEAALAQAFSNVQTLAEDAAYKVIEAGRPRRP